MSPRAWAQTVTRGPYLQNGSSTAVNFRWRTSTATNSRVRYGTVQGSLTSFVDNATSTTEHEVRVTGLSANTKYFYSVGTTTATLAGNDANHFVVTAPAAGTAKATRVWVLGDPGTGSSSQTAVRDAYYSFTGATHTDLWLMLGDNAYSSSTDAEMQAKLFAIYPTMLRKSVLFPTRGNHESATSGGVPVYYLNHTLPTAGEAGGVASGTEAYYAVNYGNIHFICLDSFATSRSPTGAMATWLQNDLAANTATWTVAFWHHPPYTKGSHDSDTESNLIEMRQNINPILENGGVDLVLTGHSHAYERSFFLDGHYGSSTTFNAGTHVVQTGDGRVGGNGAYTKSSTTPVPHAGAVYVVAGSSGQTSGGSLNHPGMFISLNQLGSMVLDVNGNRLDARFLRNTGATDDSFTIIKSSGGGGPPPAPTGLTATAGNAQIQLAWNATAGATSYNLKRSTTNGGPYSLRQGGLTQTSFTDTGLTNGTTYYYVVSAVNGSGEGPNSAQASATPSASPPGPTTFVARGAVWKYLDNGTNQGTAWRASGFNDSSWASGAAELGYGDGGEATVVSYGPSSSNKYITTYFRRSFTVSNAASYTGLAATIRRDDGAVIYINGVEAARSNMPTGTISYTTVAAGDTSSETTFFAHTLSPSLLVEGSNVIAVEIHQRSGSSSDISFNMDLIGTR